MNDMYMKIGDDDHVYFVGGEKEVLTPRHCELSFGKYKGKTLDQVDDRWYLQFMSGIAEEKKDWFLARCLELRLQQL